MAGRELVVCVSAGSNNSPRKLRSALGGRITFAGGGTGVGQTLGFAARPAVAQPEIASTQVSNNSISDGRGRGAGLLMGLSDLGQGVGLLVLGAASGLYSLGLGLGLLGGLPALGQIGRAVAPLSTQQAASEEQQEAGQEMRPGDHCGTSMLCFFSSNSRRMIRMVSS